MDELYKVLRLKKGASHAEIKRAFRARALETHPDREGNQETFALVKRAANVLLNDETRQAYDATGQIPEEKVNQPATKFINVISQIFLNVASQVAIQVDSPEHEDMVEHMRTLLKGILDQIAKDIVSNQKQKQFLEKCQARFKDKQPEDAKEVPPTAACLEHAIKRQIEMFAGREKTILEAKEHHEGALKLLDNLRFIHEVQQLLIVQTGTGASATAGWAGGWTTGS